MFGFVTASVRELSAEEKHRYSSVYCGICRQIRLRSTSFARLGLQYDMAFLALLLMSLYEPEETSGIRACNFHIRSRSWVDSPYIAYCADMNVALAYYKCLDDAQDDHSAAAKFLAGRFGKSMDAISQRWPRQCTAMAESLARLRTLEEAGCTNPDEPANCFGTLMAELLVYEEDMWSPTLRQMGHALGRFIYLADAVVDYRKDEKHRRYNPFLAQGSEADPQRWQEYLVLTMARCTRHFQHLPLVQDKSLLDNILYSGIWAQLPKGKEARHDRGSL